MALGSNSDWYVSPSSGYHHNHVQHPPSESDYFFGQSLDQLVINTYDHHHHKEPLRLHGSRSSDVMPVVIDDDIGDEIHLANMAFVNAAKMVHHAPQHHSNKSMDDEDDVSAYAPASAGFGAPSVDDEADDVGVLSGIANDP